ncbi:hypothetical protein ACE0DR_08850 [Azotobacter sp. CWF10]
MFGRKVQAGQLPLQFFQAQLGQSQLSEAEARFFLQSQLQTFAVELACHPQTDIQSLQTAIGQLQARHVELDPAGLQLETPVGQLRRDVQFTLQQSSSLTLAAQLQAQRQMRRVAQGIDGAGSDLQLQRFRPQGLGHPFQPGTLRPGQAEIGLHLVGQPVSGIAGQIQVQVALQQAESWHGPGFGRLGMDTGLTLRHLAQPL